MVGPPKNEMYFFFANSISFDFSSVNVYFFYLHQDIGSDTQNILKTNGHIITNHFVLMVHITRQILSIRKISTTLSENWDCPVFLLKSGINFPTK